MNWIVSPQQSGLINTILYNRGYRSKTERESFYNPQWKDPLAIPDIEAAITRLKVAAKKKETVLIHGDMDCDGVSSATMMESVLDWLGVNYVTYIPERVENHGLSPYVARRFMRHNGVSLIVTTDCGTGEAHEVRKIQEWGGEVIVTDHHTSYDELAPCINVNPNRHDSTYGGEHILSGSGVVLKLAQCIDINLAEQVIDLAALGTVADVMPIREENRLLVMEGLPKLTSSNRVGIKALLKAAGVKGAVDTQAISFYLAPRLNSANRMASSKLSYELLSTTDADRATEICSELNSLNTARQKLVAEIAERIFPHIREEPPVALVIGDWVSGINGLLASKIAEKYNIPAFVGTQSDGYITASARGVTGNPIDTILERASDLYPELFTGYGGHEGAGGFGIQREKVIVLWDILQELAKPGEPPSVHIDAEVALEQVNMDVVRAINELAPFGAGFPEPLLASRVRISGIIPLRGTKHNKLLFESPNGGPSDALLFFNTPDFRPGDRLDIAYNVQRDIYKGKEKPKLLVRSWRKV